MVKRKSSKVVKKSRLDHLVLAACLIVLAGSVIYLSAVVAQLENQMNQLQTQIVGLQQPRYGATNYTEILTCNFVIYLISLTTYAQSCSGNGAILFSSTSAYAVFNDAIGNLTSGGTIFVKNGTYVIAQSIRGRMINNVNLIGEGWNTILQAEASMVDGGSPACGNVAILCLSRVTGWVVKDLQFDGNGAYQICTTSPVCVGIQVDYSSHVLLNHLYIHNCEGKGAQFASTSDSEISDSVLAYNYANGFDITSWTSPYSYNDIVRNNWINGSSDVGLSIFGFDLLIEGNHVVNMTSNNSPYGTSSSHTTEGIYIGDDQNSTRVTVMGNFFDNVAGYAIFVSASQSGSSHRSYHVDVEGNQIYDCAGGLMAYYTEGLTVSHNVFQSIGSICNNPSACTDVGIKVYTSQDDAIIDGNFINDSVGTSIQSQAGLATISNNFIVVTNSAISLTAAIYVLANNNTVIGNTVDITATSLTELTGIELGSSSYGDVVSGNTVTGNVGNPTGSGLRIGGTNQEVIGNHVGGFGTCIDMLSTPVNVLIAHNTVSSCTTMIKNTSSGATIDLEDNEGYNPIGRITSPFQSSGNLINDANGASTPVNATAMTVNYSPKLIMVVIGSGWTSGYTLVIKIDGTQIISTTTPVPNTVYSFRLAYAETFYIQYESGQASFYVLGE